MKGQGHEQGVQTSFAINQMGDDGGLPQAGGHEGGEKWPDSGGGGVDRLDKKMENLGSNLKKKINKDFLKLASGFFLSHNFIALNLTVN